MTPQAPKVGEKTKIVAYCLFSMIVAHLVVSADLPVWMSALAYANEAVAIFRVIVRLS